jgi:hypothetical protein
MNKILVPFNATLDSIVALLHLLKRDRKIYLYYVMDLKKRDGMRRLACIRKIASNVYDTWGNTLESNILTDILNQEEIQRLSTAEQGETLHHEILLRKCIRSAREIEASAIYFPESLTSTESEPTLQFVSVPVPMLVKDQILAVENYLNNSSLDNPYLTPGFDLWQNVTCCRLSDIEFFATPVAQRSPGAMNSCSKCRYCKIFLGTLKEIKELG